MKLEKNFGYPSSSCKRCDALDSKVKLKVEAYWKSGSKKRIMLIGQDPTIRNTKREVKKVLMLDDKKGALGRWIQGFIPNFDEHEIYATNVVKCTFEELPSAKAKNAHKFLEPYFDRCSKYLESEIINYKPQVILTFGEPAHKLFISILKDDNLRPKMKEAFKGGFYSVSFGGHKFEYSPCLHISTFRIAEKYGEAVIDFKTMMESLSE